MSSIKRKCQAHMTMARQCLDNHLDRNNYDMLTSRVSWIPKVPKETKERETITLQGSLFSIIHW
jgi:hypothetical protein